MKTADLAHRILRDLFQIVLKELRWKQGGPSQTFHLLKECWPGLLNTLSIVFHKEKADCELNDLLNSLTCYSCTIENVYMRD